MSFRLNPIAFDENGDLTGTQPSFFSQYYGLSERYKRDLKKGWAGQFRSLIMSAINEEPYRVLYSSEPSRANTPVNLCLAALILKEMKQIPTDDDIRERLCFDMEYRYAVCCENYSQAPLSDNVLTHFRQRCIGYYAETGIDLIYDTFIDLAQVLSKFMEIDKTLVSIDSTMIAANIKKMNRLELLYTVIERLIEAVVGTRVHKKKKKTRTVKGKIDIVNGQISIMDVEIEQKEDDSKFEKDEECTKEEAKENQLPESLRRYLNTESKNITMYHNKETPYSERIARVIKDGEELISLCEEHPEYKETEEYKVFIRVFQEQCKDDGKGGHILKGKGDGMDSEIIQSPHDTEATYRSKDGKEYRGYEAVFTQAKNADGETLVLDYECEKNNVSDQELGARMAKHLDKQEPEAGAVLVGDGLFNGEAIKAAAHVKNYEIVNTNLTGKKPSDHHAEHEFDSDGNLLKCAGGSEPKSTKLNSDGSCTAKMEKSKCGSCRYRDQCNPVEQKESNSIRVSVQTKERAQEIRNRGTDQFKENCHFRNGVETVPSILKRKFNVDRIRGAGLAYKKLQLGVTFIALNVDKALGFMQRRMCYN